MSKFGGIEVTSLSEQEKSEYEQTMVEAGEILKQEAAKAGLSVKQFRNSYKNGEVSSEIMDEMIELEPVILAGWLRVVHGFIRRYDNPAREVRTGVAFEDYIQEAALGIYDAQYTYNGEDRFTTYAHRCARNKIIAFCRKKERRSPDEPLQPVLTSDRHLFDHYVEQTKKQDEISDVEEAIELAHLSELQLALFEAYAYGDRKFRKELRERAVNVAAVMLRDLIEEVKGKKSLKATVQKLQLERGVKFPPNVVKLALAGPPPVYDPLAPEIINEWNFRPVSRQRISQVFLSACEKAKEAYKKVAA